MGTCTPIVCFFPFSLSLRSTVGCVCGMVSSQYNTPHTHSAHGQHTTHTAHTHTHPIPHLSSPYHTHSLHTAPDTHTIPTYMHVQHTTHSSTHTNHTHIIYHPPYHTHTSYSAQCTYIPHSHHRVFTQHTTQTYVRCHTTCTHITHIHHTTHTHRHTPRFTCSVLSKLWGISLACDKQSNPDTSISQRQSAQMPES